MIQKMIRPRYIKKIKNYCSQIILPIFVFCFMVTASFSAKSQVVSNDSLSGKLPVVSTRAPYVYIDCTRCDFEFVRTELTFVNYVRDPELADIHVFVTDVRTSGGREYQFSFIGQRSFSSTSYSISHYIDQNMTSDETRIELNKFLKMGFASFI